MALSSCSAGANPIPVRFAEGVTRGFLVLRSADGGKIGNGDLLQVPNGDRVESRLILRFDDGSLHDETVVFSQAKVFTMLSYRLRQTGPTFPYDLDASLTREGGRYTVRSKSHDAEKEEVDSGSLDLPADVYNGMIPILVKNLPEKGGETVHIVAFSPKPHVIGLELAPAEERKVLAGDVSKTATGYLLKPQLGVVLKLFASLMGKVPPDSHCWVIRDEVPAFMAFEGPLYVETPIWRIEVVSPQWAQ